MNGPTLSQRGQNVPQSAIRKLIPLSRETERRGVKIIRLNIGQPDIETPAEFWHGVQNFGEKVLAYAPSEGRPEFVAAMREYYRRIDIALGGDEIVTTQGGIEAVQFAIFAATDAGDEIIIPEPYYSNYVGVTAMADVNFVPFTTLAENGYHLPERAAIEKLVTPRTRAIMFASPGNPTGCVYTRAEMEMLADIARQHDLFLLSDEVYREFSYEGEAVTSILQLPGLERHAVLIDSVSKRYSACGARLGVVASHNADFMAAVRAYATVRLSAPALDQSAIAACLATPPAYFEKVRAEYRERRNIVVDALSALPGVVCPRPGGAFYCMVKIEGVDTESFARWLLTDFSHNGETVMIGRDHAPRDGDPDSRDHGLSQEITPLPNCNYDVPFAPPARHSGWRMHSVSRSCKSAQAQFSLVGRAATG
ncbi:MAG: pyridoxal phosphate-dependent aminotransferase [Vicinamibacteria bacterium]|nr:pyridoxal phosphate-dependent aminotransferase [Vicinamibacteria bacterium]